MFGKLNNKNYSSKKQEQDYISWYDLSKEKAHQLEREFISKDMGRVANDAMHICVIIGIVTFVICSLVLEFLMMSGLVNPYNFTVMVILVLFGGIIVVGATIEYHAKFNSWLKVKHKIIKK